MSCTYSGERFSSEYILRVDFEQPPLEEDLNHHPLKNVAEDLVSVFENLA
jgi:hypothetical protein